jgi:hypothetical protein
MKRTIIQTIPEFARSIGLSPYRTGKLLADQGVQLYKSGNRRLVLWSALEKGFPELADSKRYRSDGSDDDE